MHPVVRIHTARLDAFDESIGTDWLTAGEAARLQAMTAPLRRRSFLAGHWLARCAAGEWLDLDPRRVEVHQHADGRPLLLVDGQSGNNIIDIMRNHLGLRGALSALWFWLRWKLSRRQNGKQFRLQAA